MIKINVDYLEIDQNKLLNLHLDVLRDLINGLKFEDIEQKYSDRFEELKYTEKASGNLLTFENGDLVGAYPVSPNKSNYKVTIDGIGTGYAMCAIDALGIAYTFLAKTKIETKLVDTRELFSFEVDPFSTKQSDKELYVSYKKYDEKVTNVALQICPSINIYRSKNSIQENADLEVIDFETALRYARERFSQHAINQCFNGSLNISNLMDKAKDGNDSTTCCDC